MSWIYNKRELDKTIYLVQNNIVMGHAGARRKRYPVIYPIHREPPPEPEKDWGSHWNMITEMKDNHRLNSINYTLNDIKQVQTHTKLKMFFPELDISMNTTL